LDTDDSAEATCCTDEEDKASDFGVSAKESTPSAKERTLESAKNDEKIIRLNIS
jgi:hypothetical protein